MPNPNKKHIKCSKKSKKDNDVRTDDTCINGHNRRNKIRACGFVHIMGVQTYFILQNC